MSRRAWFAMVLVGGMTVFTLAQAQDGSGGGGRQRRNRAAGGAAPAGQQGAGGGAEGRRGGGGYDPAQMRERMMSSIKEQMAASDDEWKTLEPKIGKTLDLQGETRPGRAAFSGRRGGDGGGAPTSKVGAAQHDLRTALDDKNTSADDLAKKVAAVREAREKSRAELKASQKDLKGSVNARQEAVLVLVGLLD